jgi:hypothetical protein
VARQIDQRARVFDMSLKMASEFQKAAHVSLLNMKLAQAQLEVRPPTKARDGHESP